MAAGGRYSRILNPVRFSESPARATSLYLPGASGLLGNVSFPLRSRPENLNLFCPALPPWVKGCRRAL